MRYRGRKQTFPYLSAVDVLEGRVPADRARRTRSSIVGTTALGTREVVATPLDTLFTGVEVQATVADNLLSGDFLRRPEHGVVARSARGRDCSGSAGTFLVVRFGLTWGLLGMCALVAADVGRVRRGALDGRAFRVAALPELDLVVAGAAWGWSGWWSNAAAPIGKAGENAPSQRLMVQTLLSLLEIREPSTGRHSRRTQTYARVLAEALATHPNFRDYLSPRANRTALRAGAAP